MSLVKTKLNDELDSYEAVDISLKLYPGMAAVLFNPDNYADEEYTDAKTVAERIRDFCLISEDNIVNTIDLFHKSFFAQFQVVDSSD